MTEHIEQKLERMLRGTVLRLNADTPCCSDADHLSAVDQGQANDDEDDDDDEEDDNDIDE